MRPRTTRTLLPLPVLALPLLLTLGACDEPGLPAGDVLLVSSVYEDRVRVLDPATGDVLDELEVGSSESGRDEPSGLAVTEDGSAWYLALGQAPPGLLEYAGDAEEPERTIPLPELRNASRVAVSPDGRWAVVTEYFLGEAVEAGQVAFVQLRTGDVGLMAPCPTPYGVAFDDRGAQVALTCPTGDEVVVLDGESLQVRHRFVATTPGVMAGGPGNPASRPMGVAWSPAGDRIYVALYDERKVAVFTPQGTFFREIDLGARPVNLAVTGRGRYLVVATREAPTVTVVDTRTGEARAMPLTDARNPHDVAVSPDGRTAYVAWEGGPTEAGGVTAVDLDAGTVLWEREAGPMTTAIAYRPGASSSTASPASEG